MTTSSSNNSDGVSKVYIRKQSLKKKGNNNKRKKRIKMGDIVDISDLVFTQERDYLIKYNQDNQEVLQIKKEQLALAGKLVVLYFVSLLNVRSNSWKPCAMDLMDIYKKLGPTGSFEVVFVAVRDDRHCLEARELTSTTYSTPQERFPERFSIMPWTAIPFSDLKSRKRPMFGIVGNTSVDTWPISYIIDPRGVVLQDHATPLFSRYGSTAYPFTRARLECLDYEDSVARKQLSISTLLASPERDYVITNKGDRVPLHKLQHKVVPLYFFTDISNEYITLKLKLVYEELCKNMEDFEVVLIDLRSIPSCPCEDDALCTCEDAFWKTFEAMPWLAIPFKDRDCSKKLLRIFENTIRDPGPDPVSKLVIIGPHGKFIEPFGANILRSYGIPAYPFTRFSVVKLMIENVKDVKPEMFWDLDAVFRQQNGSMMKGTDDEFKVIHIREYQYIGTVIPWVMHPLFDKASNANYVMHRFSNFGCNRLIAFDCGGKIVRMTTCPGVGKMVFPFYDAENMEDEVLQDVENTLDERY